MKATISAIAVALALPVLCDYPAVVMEDGDLICIVLAGGKSSKDYVDLDTPRVHAGQISLIFRQRKLYLHLSDGYTDEGRDKWSALLADMAGNEITYQIGDGEPSLLTLPLTYEPERLTIHVRHDAEVDGDNSASFNISETPLGLFLLDQEDNPPTIVIKHPVIVDNGYRLNELLERVRRGALLDRYSVDDAITTFTFQHYVESAAYCNRANAPKKSILDRLFD